MWFSERSGRRTLNGIYFLFSFWSDRFWRPTYLFCIIFCFASTFHFKEWATQNVDLLLSFIMNNTNINTEASASTRLKVWFTSIPFMTRCLLVLMTVLFIAGYIIKISHYHFCTLPRVIIDHPLQCKSSTSETYFITI